MPEPGERKRKAATAKVDPEVAARLEAKLTVELATSDLEELEQAGVISGKRAGPERPVDEPKGVILEAPPAAGPSVLVDLDAGTPAPVRTERTPRRVVEPATARPTRGGRWLVVIVYLAATAALGLAIYERLAA